MSPAKQQAPVAANTAQKPVEPPAVSLPPEEEIRTMNVYQRMHLASSLISFVHKGGVNQFQKYKYASHDDVVAKAREAFVAARLLCCIDIPIEGFKRETVQAPTDDGKVKFQSLVDLVAEVSIINVDDPKDRYVVTIPAYGLDTSDKAIGKAISYAKKYALLSLCGLMLATGDDPDADNQELDALERARRAGNGNGNGHDAPPAAKAATQQEAPAQNGALASLRDRAKAAMAKMTFTPLEVADSFARLWGKPKLSDMSASVADSAIVDLERKADLFGQLLSANRATFEPGSEVTQQDIVDNLMLYLRNAAAMDYMHKPLFAPADVWDQWLQELRQRAGVAA